MFSKLYALTAIQTNDCVARKTKVSFDTKRFLQANLSARILFLSCFCLSLFLEFAMALLS